MAQTKKSKLAKSASHFYGIALSSLFALTLLFAACGEKPNRTDQTTNASGAGPATDVSSFVTNGLKAASLIQKLGVPISERKISEDTTVMDFMFGNVGPNEFKVPFGVIGISVWVRNGKVEKFAEITGTPLPFKFNPHDRKKVEVAGLRLQAGANSIQLHPKMIAPTEIAPVQSSYLVRKAIVDLSDAEMTMFSAFLQANIGKDVSVFIENALVSRFPIRETFQSNQFEISFDKNGIALTNLLRVPMSVRKEEIPELDVKESQLGITNGQLFSDVIKRFGNPTIQKTIDGPTSVANYYLPGNEHLPPGIVGFSVFTVSNRVILVRLEPGKAENGRVQGTQSLTFQELTFKGESGSIKLKPILITPTELNPRDDKLVRAIQVIIPDSQSADLRDFTANEFGKQVTVFAGESPITEFFVLEPLKSNVFKLFCGENGISIDKFVKSVNR